MRSARHSVQIRSFILLSRGVGDAHPGEAGDEGRAPVVDALIECLLERDRRLATCEHPSLVVYLLSRPGGCMDELTILKINVDSVGLGSGRRDDDGDVTELTESEPMEGVDRTTDSVVEASSDGGRLPGILLVLGTLATVAVLARRMAARGDTEAVDDIENETGLSESNPGSDATIPVDADGD
ncbi:MAG: hypothetical protein ABEJ35_03760 [Halobacteriaceae archaeon]